MYSVIKLLTTLIDHTYILQILPTWAFRSSYGAPIAILGECACMNMYTQYLYTQKHTIDKIWRNNLD